MTDAHRQQIMNEILDAVIRCRSDDHKGDIQMTQIAAYAGISVRTLNRYYPDKDKMMFLAALNYLHSFYQKINDVYYEIDKKKLNGLEKLMIFFDVDRNVDMYDGKSIEMLIEANILGMRYCDEYYVWMRSEEKSVVNKMMEYLKQGIADGSVKKSVVAKETCHMIFSSYNGLMQEIAFSRHTDFAAYEKQAAIKALKEYNEMLFEFLKA